MIIHFLVHDGVLEVGHTRAMMEVLRLLANKDEVKKIKLICLHGSSPEILIPDHPEKLEVITLPGKNLKPFMLKSLFFQFYTWFKKDQLITPEMPVITMGVCSFIGNIVNIQFYHQDWEQLYFKYNKGGWFKNLYKKIMLRYLSLCEDIYYKKANLKFGFLSQFIANNVSKRYQLNQRQFITAYSSVNFEEFLPPEGFSTQKLELLKAELTTSYPILKGLNPNRPTLLFVGAFERKGLPFLIESLPQNVNLIVVGKGEAHSAFELPKSDQIFAIDYTNEISKFYLLADAFIFPTYYEPFGLVVTEAVASGCQILVAKERVGASEIVGDMPGISMITDYSPDKFRNQLSNIKALDIETRLKWSLLRKEALSHYTWQLCADQWWELINR